MKLWQWLISLTFWLPLVIVNEFFTGASSSVGGYLAGLRWYAWTGMVVFPVLAAIQLTSHHPRRARRMLEDPIEKHLDQRKQTLPPGFQEHDIPGLDYPHPVINPDLCISCELCVNACPHDVFTIVDKMPEPLAPEQCMEDTSCQTVCPVNPKACIVVGTTKEIRSLPFPASDAHTCMSKDVPGCYIVGDVSGRPRIKNAAREGAQVINSIADELTNAPCETAAQLHVAIIGAGPAGLSAALRAKKRKLKYVVIEQDKMLSTIDAFPEGKDIFFKPEGAVDCDLPIDSGLWNREKMLASWREASSGVDVNRGETWKKTTKAKDGDYFLVETEKLENAEQRTYQARRVILALGRRGNPMTLGGSGGKRLVNETDPRVKYALRKVNDYAGRRVLVVGGGNSAVEAAVTLVAESDGAEVTFRAPSDRPTSVTLSVRTGFTNDLKFINKQKLYKCEDAGKIKVCRDTAIKEIRAGEVELMDWPSEKFNSTIPNDDILALIGGDFPWANLEASDIKGPPKTKRADGLWSRTWAWARTRTWTWAGRRRGRC